MFSETSATRLKMGDINRHDGGKASSKCRPYVSAITGMISRYRGFGFGLASACCYACSTITVSNLSNDIGSSALTFVRLFVSAFLCLIILCYKGVTILVSSVDEFKLHIGLSVFGVTSIWCQFYAYQNMPTADACAIIYAYVGLNGVLARILFKEPFGCFEMILVLSTLTGVVLVTRPPFLFDHQGSTFNFIPPLVAFGGTISVSLSIIFMRAMGRQNIHPLKIVFWISLLSVLYLIILVTLLKKWYLPCDVAALLRVLAVSVFAFLGLTLINYSLAQLNTVYASILSMNEVYVVFLLDTIFFGFQPQWSSVVGILIITGSSIVISLKKVLTSSDSNKSDSEKNKLDESASQKYVEDNSSKLATGQLSKDYSVLRETEEKEKEF